MLRITPIMRCTGRRCTNVRQERAEAARNQEVV